MIDADPLVLANDPSLHNLLDSLYSSGIAGTIPSGAVVNMLKTLLEWTGFILLKILQVGVEILV